MAIVVIAQNLVDSSPSLGKVLRAKMEEKHSQGHCIETTQLNETFAEQNAELLHFNNVKMTKNTWIH